MDNLSIPLRKKVPQRILRMINVGIYFDNYVHKDDSRTIYLLIQGGAGAPAKVKTGIAVPQTHWNGSEVTKAFGNRSAAEMNAIIRRKRVDLERFIEEIQADRWGYSNMEVKKMYLSPSKEGINVIDRFRQEILKKERQGKKGSARNLWESMMKLIEYVDKRKHKVITEQAKELPDYTSAVEIVDMNLPLGEINKSFLSDYDEKMSCRAPNSRGKHLRALRAIVNDLIDEFELDMRSPFKRFKIPKGTPNPKGLTIEEIREIDKKDLPYKEWFICSFLLGGIAFKDMYWINDKVTGDYVVYQRGKLSEDNPRPIIKTLMTDRVKTFIKNKPLPKDYKDYRAQLRRINEHMGKVGVTSHVARHSWTMIAKSLGYSYQLRKEIFGHAYASGSGKHYEGGFDQSVKDECVLRVAGLLTSE